MNFELSDEQRMLQESLQRFLADTYSFEARRRHLAQETGYDPAVWRSYADLGLLALPFAEADGGLGGGAVETMIVMEALGSVLAVEPYLSTAVLAASLLRNLASAEERAALVPQVAAGELLLAVAYEEPGSWYEPSLVATRARRVGEGWRLSGAKTLVLNGDQADKLLVTARLAGAAGDEGGIGLFLLDGAAAGLARRGYPTQDGLRAAELQLDEAEAEALIGGSEDALPALRRALDEALAAVSAEAVGAMAAALALTVDYLKTRRQFDAPLGKFQALQHRASEMLVAIEQARSMALYATMMCREEDRGLRERALSAAKIQIGRSVRFVGQQAVQLHGGVAMTMEYAIGHYMKRLTMIEKAFGDTDFHLERLSAAGGLAA